MIDALSGVPFKLEQWEVIVSIASSILLREIEKTVEAQPIGPLCETPEYGVTQSAHWEPVGPKFVRITDIRSGSIDWSSVPHCLCDEPEKFQLASGDVLIARSGSIGKTFLVGTLPETAVFASYLIRIRPRQELLPEYLYWCCQSTQFWTQLLEQSRGSAIKNINRGMLQALRFPVPNRHLQARFAAFLSGVAAFARGEIHSFPVFHLYPQQRRIVAKLESIAAKIGAARQMREAIQVDAQAMLHAAFERVIAGAKHCTMGEIAPSVRRPVAIEADGEYPELGLRWFGKGTFHKPSVSGIDVGTKKLYRIQPGDVVLSNAFAWDGAIAVARAEDSGRVASHRFITCVADEGATTPAFLCFYLLSEQGIDKIREASLGRTPRNRALRLSKLEQIDVPVPAYDKQLWFDRLQAQVAAITEAHVDNQTDLDALLPAIFDRAYAGAL